ncbi:hypothetical protein NITLEN_60163 [Nitrospira lenta]|uniref:Uncharacterized protein n=1 Tax=Nitrospira lenta TaxID=1436998 RepID=A0A330L8U9_9BACT|nr:hypothetical protein NITLEN_60163 [Nitrospira lenta]
MSLRNSGDIWSVMDWDLSAPKLKEERPNVKQTRTAEMVCLWVRMACAPFMVRSLLLIRRHRP